MPIVFDLAFNISHLFRPQTFEEGARLAVIKLRIIGLDAKEKPVNRSPRKARHIEHRVIRLRQVIHDDVAQEGAERCQQDGAFKCDRDKGVKARRTSIVFQAAESSAHHHFVSESLSRPQ